MFLLASSTVVHVLYLFILTSLPACRSVDIAVPEVIASPLDSGPSVLPHEAFRVLTPSWETEEGDPPPEDVLETVPGITQCKHTLCYVFYFCSNSELMIAAEGCDSKSHAIPGV